MNGMPTPPKILIVDDEEGIRTTLCEFIRQSGHECSSAAGGQEALEILENETAFVQRGKRSLRARHLM